MTSEHPSFFQLDEFALTVATATSDSAEDLVVRDHVASCETCEQHIARIAKSDLIDTLPAALRSRAEGSRFGMSRESRESKANKTRRRWLAWVGPLALAGAAAAALLFFLSTQTNAPTSETAEYIGVKGGRTVGLYIKRNERVTLWNGRSSVAADDRLRLAIVSPGHTQVAVYTRIQTASETRFEPIFRGELEPFGPTLLAKAWQVDNEAGPEVLLVVTSENGIDDDGLRSTFEELTSAAVNNPLASPEPLITGNGQWIRLLILNKEPTP